MPNTSNSSRIAVYDENPKTTIVEESSNYSKEQIDAITYATATTAFISLICSIFIIQHVLRSSKRNKVKTYHRLLISLSFWDVISSTANFGFSIYELVVAPNDAWIAGTALCTANGFILVISVGGAAMYNACLSIFFWLVVEFQLSDHVIATRYEPVLHGIAHTATLSMGIAGLALHAFNPIGVSQGCGFSPYPAVMECDDDNDCWERGGESAWKLRDTFVYSFYVVVIILLFTNISMYCKVRRTEHRNLRFQSESIRSAWNSNRRTNNNNINNNNNVNGNYEPGSSMTTHHRHQQQHGRAQKLAIQSFLFCGGFFLTYIFSAIQPFLSISDDDVHDAGTRGHYVLSVLGGIFWPLQGFFDFLVYFRPRYLQWRRRNPTRTRWFAMKQATLTVQTPCTIMTRRTTSSSPGIVVMYCCFCQRQCGKHQQQQHDNMTLEQVMNNNNDLPTTSEGGRQVAMVLIDEKEEEQDTTGVVDVDPNDEEMTSMVNGNNDDEEEAVGQNANMNVTSSAPVVVSEVNYSITLGLSSSQQDCDDGNNNEDDEEEERLETTPTQFSEGGCCSGRRRRRRRRRTSILRRIFDSRGDDDNDEKVFLDETDERIAETLQNGGANNLYTANHLDST